MTINELAKTAIELTKSRSVIRHIPYTEAYGEGFEDMRRRVPSLAKAERYIGYQRTKDLAAIIRDVSQDLAARTDSGAAG